MRLYNIIRRLKLFVPGMAIVGLASCQDEFFQELDYTSSGEDVTLTVPISMPEMTLQSRADISDYQLTQVNSLWIAVFSTSGEMTSQNARGEIGWHKVQNPSNGGYESVNKEVELKAKTGPSYIVAVANVENPGVKMNDDGTFTEAESISTLLTDGMTWTDFLSIGAATPSTQGTVNAPTGPPLTMSGCYSSLAVGGTHPADWQENNFTSIYIPRASDGSDKVTFTETKGAIHLRRTVSHITFNVSIGETATEIIDAEVLSYRVCNLPKQSWLYERGTDVANTDGKTNIGDNATSLDEAEKNYQTSITFPTQYIEHNKIDRSNPGTATFDFWMAENKHTGIINIDNYNTDKEKYNQREAKYKVGDTYTIPAIYTSLVNGDTWTANNMATYVVLTCNVTYRNQLKVDGNGNQPDQDNYTPPASDVYRTGVAEYTVHLGYIKNDANDFNSYRNSNYTYNVTITGLESIRLEAIRDGERNAAEGVVTDVVNPTVTLDSHSHTFNIVLTQDELVQNANQLDYIITTYESGNAHTFTYEQYKQGGIASKYMNWIEIKPTTAAEVYADYVPAQGKLLLTTQENEDRVMSIHDFIALIKGDKTEVNGCTKAQLLQVAQNSDGNYYFTVFVNEYSYELRYGETNPNNSEDVYGNEDVENRWTTYINQNPRRFYLQTQKAESTDGNSIYSRSKYAIQQRSMQSFYSSTNFNSTKTAFALEHINETQGLNLRYTYNGEDNENGRYNVWQWLNYSTYNYQWSNFVSLATPQVIPNVTQIGLQGGPAIPTSEWHNPADMTSSGGYTHLPSTVKLGGPNANNQYTGTTSANDPQTINGEVSTDREDYIQAINACMNRNRDENGNGIIDAAELKWYVPASGKYLRAILGRASLTSPLMPYTDVSELPETDNSKNSRYLVYASNNMVLWAMEGLSASTLELNNFQPPWQVRCIRNLGTDLRSVSQGEKVTMAYRHEASTRKVILTNYDPASIRTVKYTGAGNSSDGNSTMSIHSVTSDMNRVYSAFQYTSTGFISSESITFNGTNSAHNYIAETDPCNDVTEGNHAWRLPNQKELAIMRNLEVLETGTYTWYDNKSQTWYSKTRFRTGTTNNYTYADYSLSCTYDYYDINGKNGGSDFDTTTPNHYFMGSRVDGGTRLSNGNLGDGHQMYIRCVRDVEPNEN